MHGFLLLTAVETTEEENEAILLSVVAIVLFSYKNQYFANFAKSF